MSYWRAISVASVFMVAVACGGDDDRAAADSALARDLSLANQVSPYPAMDSLSAIEGGYAPATRSTASRPTSTTPRTTSTARRSSSTGTRSTTGTVSTSSGGEVVVKKNTKRDAIIGAAAGAAIGAATSRDKLKGAVIGGVVGGVLGGVIGNNVDVQKTKKPPQ